MLQYLLERLQHAGYDRQVVVATSDTVEDAPVGEFCRDFGVECVRGSLPNVALRFLQVLELHPAETFIRICGDSPLFDPELIAKSTQLAVEGNWDLVTNVAPRTYPPGQSVEVVRVSSFQSAYTRFTDAEDFEHVTKFLYKHPEAFRIRNFEATRSYPGTHLAIDTPGHLRTLELILERMTRPHWEYGLDEVMTLLEQGSVA